MNGFIILDKPAGITSAEAIRLIKKSLHPKKIGYIGTLDPIATGVLPVGLGKATKLFPYLEKESKSYTAVMKLGSSTDTQDRTGKVISEADASEVTEENVKDVLLSFKGEIEQIPPMFSAKKIDGKRLYTLAREGKTVERKPVTIFIEKIDFLGKNGDEVKFSVDVASGAYVRTLCHDAGEKLGVGAHLKELVRTASGKFRIEDSVKLETIEAAEEESDHSFILSLSDGLKSLSSAVVISHALERLQNGQPVGVSEVIDFEDIPDSKFVKIIDKKNRLLAIGTIAGAPVAGFPFTSLQPKKVFFT